MPSATWCICRAHSFHTWAVQTPMLIKNDAVLIERAWELARARPAKK
jgi:hypothetical protein